MNTKLKSLFEEYNISEKDKYEINQIYGLLPVEKKINLLNNFETLALKLVYIHKQINLERRILVGDVLTGINKIYSRYN